MRKCHWFTLNQHKTAGFFNSVDGLQLGGNKGGRERKGGNARGGSVTE